MALGVARRAARQRSSPLRALALRRPLLQALVTQVQGHARSENLEDSSCCSFREQVDGVTVLRQVGCSSSFGAMQPGPGRVVTDAERGGECWAVEFFPGPEAKDFGVMCADGVEEGGDDGGVGGAVVDVCVVAGGFCAEECGDFGGECGSALVAAVVVGEVVAGGGVEPWEGFFGDVVASFPGCGEGFGGDVVGCGVGSSGDVGPYFAVIVDIEVLKPGVVARHCGTAHSGMFPVAPGVLHGFSDCWCIGMVFMYYRWDVFHPMMNPGVSRTPP